MFPYTLKKTINVFFLFNLCKVKNKTILSHGFMGKQVLYPLFAPLAFYCSYSSVPVSQEGRVTITSDEPWNFIGRVTGWGIGRDNCQPAKKKLSSLKHAFCPYHVHSSTHKKSDWCKVFGDPRMVFTTAEPLCICHLQYLHRVQRKVYNTSVQISFVSWLCVSDAPSWMEKKKKSYKSGGRISVKERCTAARLILKGCGLAHRTGDPLTLLGRYRKEKWNKSKKKNHCSFWLSFGHFYVVCWVWLCLSMLGLTRRQGCTRAKAESNCHHRIIWMWLFIYFYLFF